jgi:hypothetical protein
MGVELTEAFVQHAQLVIAEVNDHITWTEGHSKLFIREIDYWIDKDQPLLTTLELWPFFYQQAFSSEDVFFFERNCPPCGCARKSLMEPLSNSVWLHWSFP